MKVTIKLLSEIPFVHKMMDVFDLSERGRKVYCKSLSINYNQDFEDEQSFIKGVEKIAFEQHQELQNTQGIGKPVFIFAYSDKNHYLMYFRKGINEVSDGIKSVLFSDYIKHLDLYPIEGEMRTIEQVGLLDGDSFYPIPVHEYKQTNE